MGTSTDPFKTLVSAPSLPGLGGPGVNQAYLVSFMVVYKIGEGVGFSVSDKSIVVLK